MQKEDKEESNKGWKTLATVAGAAVVGGLAYYLGYEVAKQEHEEAEERKQALAAAQRQYITQVAIVCVTVAVYVAYYLGYQVAHSVARSQPYSHAGSMGDCAICLRKMRPVRQLNCGHHFHDECVGQWLPGNSTCPLCRRPQLHAHEHADAAATENCAICRENMALKRLPCGHFFHDECISKWESQNPICPLCRASTSRD